MLGRGEDSAATLDSSCTALPTEEFNTFFSLCYFFNSLTNNQHDQEKKDFVIFLNEGKEKFILKNIFFLN